MKPRITRSLLRFLAGVVACSTIAQAEDLTWNGTADTNVWNTDAQNTDWLRDGTTAAPFAAEDNVTFGTVSDPVTSTVDVGEVVQTVSMTVNDNYTFSTAAEGAIVADSLVVADGATVGMDVDFMVGSLNNGGTVNSTGDMRVLRSVENGGDVTASSLLLLDMANFNTLNTDALSLNAAVSKEAPIVTARTLGAATGDSMELTLEGSSGGSGDYLVVRAEDMGETSFTLSQETARQFMDAGYMTELKRAADGVVLTLDSYNDGRYARVVRTSNGHVGAALLDQAFADLDPQEYRNRYRDLAMVMDAMNAYIASGNNGSADALAASVAGAGIANLNTAWRGQMERQLRSIRNRMTSMQGGMPCYSPDPKAPMANTLPYTLWANAELDYQNLRDDGSLPGFKLRSIGGTAGFTMLAAPELTVGAAFTGMAGRFSSKGYGSNASGDLDAYYASIFTRMDTGCVQHSLIGSVGWSDINLKRRVYFPGGGYGTRGTTDGLGMGLMYEMARSYRISEDTMKSAWWQPVLNISYIHSKVDGYSESGSDAALRVGKQDSNNVVFGLGARMQGIVGEEFMNTPAVMEARLLGKATTGGRRGKAHVSIPGVAADGTVRGSEASALGVELGLGFNIPLGKKYGAIITDFTAEFYQDQSSVNGILGYRIDF